MLFCAGEFRQVKGSGLFMRKIKLMTLLGTRSEIIRLSAIIKKCDLDKVQ